MKTATLALAAFLAIFAFALPAPAAESAPADPAKTVQAFYAFHLKHTGFDTAIVKASKTWLDPKLYTLLLKAASQPVAKGDAPDIEGDVFTDSQDDPISFHVGKATVTKDTARVAVSFTWSAKDKREYTILLSLEGGEWRITDIEYGDHRTMVKELRDAAH